MSTLVTGSEGFIGRHLLDALGYDDICEVDIKNGVDCRDVFATDEHFDVLFHCAATVGGREGIEYHSAFLGADNLSIDGSMWSWALRTRPSRIVYFSSAAAYPTASQMEGALPMVEKLIAPGHCGFPDASYGWVKLTGEVMAECVRRAGIPVSVVRPFSSYDYDQDPCYPFPAFIHRAVKREDPFTVWGDGTQVRDWIHVSDLVEAVLRMVHLGIDGPVNLSTGRGTSMDELAWLCMEAAGYEAPIEHLLSKPVGVHTRVGDNSELLSFYKPQVSIEEGVERAVWALGR